MSEGGPDSRHKDGWAGRTCGNERGGGQCTVCRGGLGDRPVLSQSGCSAWAMARGATQSGGSVGGGRLSKRDRMREGRVHAVERGMSGDGPWCRRSNGEICGGGGADVAGPDGEVRGGKKRTMLLNCPDPISSELVWVTLASALSVVALLAVYDDSSPPGFITCCGDRGHSPSSYSSRLSGTYVNHSERHAPSGCSRPGGSLCCFGGHRRDRNGPAGLQTYTGGSISCTGPCGVDCLCT